MENFLSQLEKFQSARQLTVLNTPDKSLKHVEISPEMSVKRPTTPENQEGFEKTPSNSQVMDISIFSPPKALSDRADFSKMRQAENAISETTSGTSNSEKCKSRSKSSNKTESGGSDWMAKELTKDSPETQKRKEEMTGTMETLSLDKLENIRELIDMKRKCTPNKGIYNPSQEVLKNHRNLLRNVKIQSCTYFAIRKNLNSLDFVLRTLTGLSENFDRQYVNSN